MLGGTTRNVAVTPKVWATIRRSPSRSLGRTRTSRLVNVPVALVVTPAAPMPGCQARVTGVLAGKCEPLTATTVPGGPTVGSRLIFGGGDPGGGLNVGVSDGSGVVGVLGMVTLRVV